MQSGIFLFTAQFAGMTHGEVLGSALEYAITAERHGYDDAWITEHHFIPYGLCPSATTMAGFILGRTNRLKVGTAVSLLPLHHPVQLAEQTALLDHLSTGRFQLGVGRGGPVIDLEVFGSSLARYERGLPESVDLLLQTWTHEAVAADGEFFKFRGVSANPRPLTQPHPPLYVACHSGNTIEVAAQRGLPMLLFLHLDDDAKLALLTRYNEIAVQHGHDPTKIKHIWAVVGYVADNQAEAQQVVSTTFPPWLKESAQAYQYLRSEDSHRENVEGFLAMILQHHPIGTPEYCIERLATTMARTGLQHVMVVLEAPADRQRSLENIERFSTEVLAKLRSCHAE
jgi:alkanesulfonate monooxygenase SsuD/methylene tetrahydromethanopterin reductase-like flavin-dependent oxidoreductase (luciferase family)